MPFWLWSICSGGTTSEFLEVQGEREEHSSCAASSGSGLVTVNKHPAFTRGLLFRENEGRVRRPVVNVEWEGPGMGTSGQEGCSYGWFSESRRKYKEESENV